MKTQNNFITKEYLDQSFERFAHRYIVPLYKEVHILKKDVRVLKKDVCVLKKDVKEIRGDIIVMKNDIQDIKKTLNKHDKRITATEDYVKIQKRRATH